MYMGKTPTLNSFSNTPTRTPDFLFVSFHGNFDINKYIFNDSFHYIIEEQW